MIRSVLFLLLLAYGHVTYACSCFGPQTFCGTLDPPYEEPQWWVPDVIILGTKVAQEAHGMDVEVLETISGNVEAGEILRVWGDCGLLCRVYPDAWAIGDTVVWALKITDLMGNGLCGTSLEQEGDYMISICGTYYLDFDHGTVSGPIAEGVDELPYEDFVQFTNSCLAMMVPGDLGDLTLETRISENWLIARSEAFKGDRIEHQLFDVHGRLISEGSSSGHQVMIPIQDLARGVHLLRIKYGIHSRSLRVLVP